MGARAAPANPFQGHVANWAGRAPAPAPAERGSAIGSDRAGFGGGDDGGGGAAEATDMCAPVSSSLAQHTGL